MYLNQEATPVPPGCSSAFEQKTSLPGTKEEKAVDILSEKGLKIEECKNRALPFLSDPRNVRNRPRQTLQFTELAAADAHCFEFWRSDLF
jgi:hypothetical protein